MPKRDHTFVDDITRKRARGLKPAKTRSKHYIRDLGRSNKERESEEKVALRCALAPLPAYAAMGIVFSQLWRRISGFREVKVRIQLLDTSRSMLTASANCDCELCLTTLSATLLT